MGFICWLALLIFQCAAATIPALVSSEVSSRGHASVLVELANKDNEDAQSKFHAGLNGACQILQSWPAVRVVHIDATPTCLDAVAASTSVVAVDLTGSAFLVAADSLTIPRYQRAAILGTGLFGSAPELREAFQQEVCFCATGCCPGGTDRQFGELAATTAVTGRSTEGVALRAARPGHTNVIDGNNISLLSIRLASPLDSTVSMATILDAMNWLLVEKTPIGMVILSFESDEVFCGPCEGVNVANRAMASYISQLKAQGIRVLTPNLGYRIRGVPACLPGIETFPASLDLPVLSAEVKPIGYMASTISSITTFASALAPPIGWAVGEGIPLQVSKLELSRPVAFPSEPAHSVSSVYAFRNFSTEYLPLTLRGMLYYIEKGPSPIYVLNLSQFSSCSFTELSKGHNKSR